MRFVVDKSTLQDNLAKVLPAAVSKASILECVLIEAEDVVVFTTDDMRMQKQTGKEAGLNAV